MKIKVDADIIKKRRGERCWSQEHVAEMAGISLRTIQRIENGETASRDTAMALAAAFDVDVSVLMLDVNGKIEQSVARKKAKKMQEFRLSFWIHLASFMFVIGLLVSINLAKSPERIWVLWPAIGWGIGVLAHGMSVFIVSAVARMEQQSRDRSYAPIKD